MPLVGERSPRHCPQNAHHCPMTEKLTAPGHGFRGVFRDDIAARAVYAESAGIGRVMPRAVAVPESADDVVALVQWAREGHLALVPRASGSSMPGGAIG